MDSGQLLPRPGPVWGAYPLRAADDDAAPWRAPSCAALLRLALGPKAQARRTARSAAQHAQAFQGLDAVARASALQSLRRELRRNGLQPAMVAKALGLVAACAQLTMGQTPRHSQLMAAAALLDQRLAEMATGEGKTLALALAASVAALAGMPVHLVTANAYLAARDAAGLAPLYAALGLSVSALPSEGDDVARRAAYAQDIVYATASALAFDFLRDRLARRGRSESELRAVAWCAEPAAAAPAPLMRGLCAAFIDEIDSILLDEAEVPLILSRNAPQAARRAFLWQALALARQLQAGRDFDVDAQARRAHLHPAGEETLARLAAPLGGPWQRPRYRREAVAIALTGLHACLRDTHYVVRNGAIELLDEVSGRIAVGRVWSRGLHTVVALKEGLQPPDETDTVAQTSFQRFFQRYWRVAGVSGTLLEARGELHALLGTSVMSIPLASPCQRQQLPAVLFDNLAQRWQSVTVQIAALQAAGRPVLVGTDSVADSLTLSQHLLQAGIAHQVLNALNDADEAAIVAGAGSAGQVTVATRMAGRGTDIRLDAQALAAGGLHVVNCQNNPSKRLDRQLAGRAARQGDPGSAQICLLRSPLATEGGLAADTPPIWTLPVSTSSSRLALMAHRWNQWREHRRRAALRLELLRQDRQWEQRHAFAGTTE